ncbi:MAG: hypothetical protein WAN22_13740 [Solirubrobacteraceae bacterium]
MDPIHPIVPVAPNIPSVTPAPMAGRVYRDGARSNADQGGRRRQRGGRGPESAPATYVSEDGQEYYPEAPEDDDSGLHINVTA